MHAIETERSPGLPSLMVTTRRRLMPHGTSCSFLQAVTQALHSMQRSLSQRNFILAMMVSFAPLRSSRLDTAQGHFGFLHEGHGVVAIGRDGVDRVPKHNRIGSGRVLGALVLTLPVAGEVERHERHTLPDAVGDPRHHPDL